MEEGIYMSKNFIVIGLGRFGTSTAIMLTKLGHEVLAIDKRSDRVNAVKGDILHVIQADMTDEHAAMQLGVANFDCVIICIGGDIRASVLSTVLCREMGATYIVAKAHDDLHALLLKKTGADRVVQPEYDGGVRLARSLVNESFVDSINLSDDFTVNEIGLPKNWAGKSLSGLSVRNRYGVSVIAIRRDGHLSVHIKPDEILHEGDTLFVLGTSKSVQKLLN